MTKRCNNWYLLVFLIGFMTLSSMYGMFGLPDVYGLSSVIPYLIMIAIGFLFCMGSRTVYWKFVPYNVGIKPSIILISVLLVFLLEPTNAILGEIGSMIGGNTLALFSQQIASENNSLFADLVSTAVVPAVFEEFFFRGVFFAGFKRSGGARKAILWSALFFGLFHMNLQQFLYAAFIGLVLAVMRELTGSMWPGMILHFVNNGLSVLDLHFPGLIHARYVEHLTITGSTSDLILTIVLAVVGLVITFFLLRYCAKVTGKSAVYAGFFKGDKGEGKGVVSAGFILALIVCILVIILMALVIPSTLEAMQTMAQSVTP